MPPRSDRAWMVIAAIVVALGSLVVLASYRGVVRAHAAPAPAPVVARP